MTGVRGNSIKRYLTLSASTEVRLGRGLSPTVPFWSLVDQSGGPDACWPWTRGKDPAGYGHGAFGWTRKAHRQAYRLANGDFDLKLDVAHHCDNPPCCNPRHLFAATRSENILDASRKGRLNTASGERHSQSKLTWEKVRAIRAKAAAGVSQHQLGREYGVSQVCIHFVVTRATWAKDPLDAEAVA